MTLDTHQPAPETENHRVARAAATAVDGFFFEVHDRPEQALSDGPNAFRLEDFGPLLDQLQVIWRAGRQAALQDPAGRLR